MTTARIYVACLASYNNGKLHGRWIPLTDGKTLREGIKAMLAESPEPGAEEWAVHDYDGIPKAIADRFGEYPDFAALYAFVDVYTSMDACVAEAFAIWYADHGDESEYDSDNLSGAFHAAYIGEFLSREDFGEYIAELFDYLQDIPEHLHGYFNYDAFGHDLLCTDYWEQNGHYFRHC